MRVLHAVLAGRAVDAMLGQRSKVRRHRLERDIVRPGGGDVRPRLFALKLARGAHRTVHWVDRLHQDQSHEQCTPGHAHLAFATAADSTSRRESEYGGPGKRVQSVGMVRV
jgi:hypothetical protein